jgi:hypothetical protein
MRSGDRHGAGRIRRRVDHDRARARADLALDRFGSILKAVLLRHPDVDRPALGIADEIRVTRVVRIAQDHLVARIQQVSEEQQHGGRGAGRDEDLIRRDRHTVGARIVLGDRLSERQDPEAMGVARPTVLDRTGQRVSNDRRRLEVGLAELQVHDVDAGALELLRALGDLDGQERLDLLDAPRERHARLLLTRWRAVRICQSMPGPCRKTPTLLPA